MHNDVLKFLTQNPTEEIAKQLLGCELSFYGNSEVVSGYIVETEAYLGDKDTAAHSYKHRKSNANKSLFKQGGHLYVHTMRGLILMNIVCQEEGIPQGVLLRAIEPNKGIDLMHKNRHCKDFNELTNGPAKLTQAFGIKDLSLDGSKVNDGLINLNIKDKKKPKEIVSSARIGVSKGSWEKKPLRFYVQGNPYVSKTKKSSWNMNSLGWN